MRSLVLCPYLPDAPDHGGKIRSRVLLAALARLGDVHVAAPTASDEGEAAGRLAAELGVEIISLPPADEGTSAVRKLTTWARGRSELLERRWSPGAMAAVCDAIDRSAPDLLVVDSSHSLPLLPAQPSSPLLLHLHNIESALLARADEVQRPAAERWQRAVEARMIGRLEARWAAHAELTITTSELDRERLVALAPGAAVEVVENAVDTTRLALLAPPAIDVPPRLLFVGSLNYPPNREAAYELLVQHLPALRAAYPDIAVRIVGRDDNGDITRLAAECGVEATGWVEDLLPHYADATAVYLPIRSGGGTRIKVIEAFALGRPVLSTAVGVEGLNVTPDEHYLRVEQPSDGVAAVGRILADGGGPMLTRARALAEKRWSHDAAVDAMARVLRARFGVAAG